MIRFSFSLCLFFLLLNSLSAQSISSTSWLNNRFRCLQLTRKLDSTISFNLKPFNRNKILGGLCLTAEEDSGVTRYGKDIFSGKGSLKPRFGMLPAIITQQYNSHHPYGWNDGAMIAAKGYQVLASMGVYASAGPLEVQIQPEFVYAANSSYQVNADYGSNTGKSFQQFFIGQSYARVSAFSLAAGFSTENISWGPGIHSSLLMSNNAPGFLHGFFKTTKPIVTGAGSFEFEIIGGKLTKNVSRAFENRNLQLNPSTGYNRYINGLTLSYQPKWTPGLFLGFARSIQTYSDKMLLNGGSLLNRYLPIIFKPIQKQNASGDDTLNTDQLASLFLRWVLPAANAEFYFEYGFNDYGQNTRDIVMAPTHSAAYIVGAKRIFPLTDKAVLDIGIELTQMTQSPDHITRDAGNWYVHSEITEGYTHQNQILGAGAGLGCNVQTVSGTWIKGWKQLGILLERVERDPQYHVNKWIDYSIGILPQWKYGNMLISGKLQFINSSQYAWQKEVNRFNLHSRVSVQYLF